MKFSAIVRGCAVVLPLLVAGAAKAGVLYTVTTTGTVTSGSSSDFGAGLIGSAYSLTETYSLSTGTVQNGTNSRTLSNVLATGVMTINGHSITFSSQGGNNEYLLQNQASLGGFDYLDASSNFSSNGGGYFESILYSADTDFLASDNLAQVLFLTLPANVTNDVGNNGSQTEAVLTDGSSFIGNITTLSLNGGAATPVPEPTSLVLFGAGLAGLGLLRRTRRFRA